MKPRTLEWWGVTAAAAASVLCWYLLTMEPDASSRTVGKGLASAAQVTGNGTVSSPAEPLPKFGTPEFKSALKERGEKWLDSRGRDAAGLIAMWDITRDGRLLFEADKNFPNDPRVCMTMFYCAGGPAKWKVESLIAAEPDNPLGLYLKAWAFSTGGWEHAGVKDRPGAIEALRQAAVLNGRPYDHTLERIKTAREAALACGADPGDAVRLALDGPLRRSMTTGPIQGITNALSEELAEAKATGNDELLKEIVFVGMNTAEKFSDARPLSISDEWNANTLKTTLLAALPADKEIGDRGLPAGDQRDEAEERIRILDQCAQRIDNVRELMATASDDVMITFYLVLMRHGEEDAQLWLLSQSGKAK